jgi:hypothetical protein
MKKEIEPYYQGEAKRIIDAMFDNKVFNEKMTRDDMQGFEDLLAYYMQSNVESAKRGMEFAHKIKHLK